MKKRIIKNVKGITLVALVVTIIVLLILSGVAISLSLGDDGIFKRAKEGAKTYQNARINEKIELDEVSNYIEDYLKDIDTSDFDLQDLGYNTVPDGMYFVLGDNRDNSLDSRKIGLVEEDDIIGEIAIRFWPITNFRLF